MKYIKIISLGFALIFFALPTTASADGGISIYNDSLNSGWSSWSWNSNVNFENTNPVSSGSDSISFNANSWGGLYLHANNLFNTTALQNLEFSVYSTNSNQKLGVIVYDSSNNPLSSAVPLSKYGNFNINGWKSFSVPLSDLNAANHDIQGIAFQDLSGQNQQLWYLDQINLTFYSAAASSSSAILYKGSLVSPWTNWSWNSNVNFNSSTPIYSESSSLLFSPNAWGGLYLHSENGFDTTPYTYFHFVSYGSAQGQKLSVMVYDSNNQPTGGGVSLDNFGGQLTSGQWKAYNIPLSALNAENKQIKGIAIQDISGQNQSNIGLNEIEFTSAPLSILSSSTISLTPTPGITSDPAPTPTSSPIIPSGDGYTVSQGEIYHNGSSIKLKGLSWFGMETGTHVVHGLWVRNWKDMINQMKGLGFNAVRLPFCPATLNGVTPSSIDYSKNSDLQGLDSLQIMDKIVNELNSQGMYILLDHHTPDCNAISQLWYTSNYSESQWISDLTTITERYASLPYFLGVDLKNEPHGSATWGTGNSATDWNKAAERAGSAVLTADPKILIFVEGVGSNPVCSSSDGHWDGGNLEPVNCAPISTSAIPADKLVFSPHVYGPDVYFQSYFGAPNFPSNMPSIWTTQWGFLLSKGYTVVPGEWGGKYGTLGGNPLDITWQNAFVSYLEANHVCSSFYWDWNPNSGDTGGILQDDWTTPWASKVNHIMGYFNSCN